MPEQLVEPTSKYHCPIHRNVKATARLNGAGNYYIVTCPICGVCGKEPI